MRVPHLSPQAYRRITLVAAILLAIIIVTGGAVRLTDSGLGCPVGLSCPAQELHRVAVSSEHRFIEHAKRLFTGAVSIAVIVAVLGSLVRVRGVATSPCSRSVSSPACSRKPCWVSSPWNSTSSRAS